MYLKRTALTRMAALLLVCLCLCPAARAAGWGAEGGLTPEYAQGPWEARPGWGAALALLAEVLLLTGVVCVLLPRLGGRPEEGADGGDGEGEEERAANG